MSNRLLSKAALSAAILSIGIYSTAHAHSGGATLDARGGNPSATALAVITCSKYTEFSEEPAKLIVKLKDISPPVEGLLLSVQIYKGTQAISITDPVSGNADYSPAVELNAGPGAYQVLLDKTAAGPRQFDLIWHCESAEGIHTETQINVRQFQ